MNTIIEIAILLLTSAVALGVVAHVLLHIFVERREAFLFNLLALLSLLVGGLFIHSKINDQSLFDWPPMADFGFVGVGAVLIAALLALETAVDADGKVGANFLGFKFSGPAGPMTLMVLLLIGLVFTVWSLTGHGTEATEEFTTSEQLPDALE